MFVFDFTGYDNMPMYPELCFNSDAHVTSIPTLDISMPSVLKAAEKDFYRSLSVKDRKSFRTFCHAIMSLPTPLHGNSLILPLIQPAKFSAILAVYRNPGTISVRCLKNHWDIYDPSMPVFQNLTAIVKQFCKECNTLDSCLTAGVFSHSIPAASIPMLSDLMPGYTEETITSFRESQNPLCDIRKITAWILDKIQLDPTYGHTDFSFYDPSADPYSDPVELLIPLHLSAWMHIFLLLVHILSSLSTEQKVGITLLNYEDKLDFRWEIRSTLSSQHFKNDHSLSVLSDVFPQLRVPVELVQALAHRHGFSIDLNCMRSHLTCTLTVCQYTNHLLDFKFNDPMNRASLLFTEVSGLVNKLQSFNVPQAEESVTE